MIISRLVYLFYYIKKLDWEKFRLFFKYARSKSGMHGIFMFFDMVSSVFVYNVSILEYFQFGFYEKDKVQRKKWAGTGFMYEYQRLMNPPGERLILDDKRLFHKNYREYIKHNVYDLEYLSDHPDLIDLLLDIPSQRMVFKVHNGKCGKQVLTKAANEFEGKDLIDFMRDQGFDLVEEYILQHASLMQLSPSAVNTIRIFTQLTNEGNVNILGCRLRISVNSPVDNMAAGNLAAPVDTETGIITGPAVYSDITKPEVFIHPITGVTIVGFQIPYWRETIDLAVSAAKLHPANRSIGWDIAMTESGPDLIEGNHDWCKLLFQLPVKEGLKYELTKYLI